MEESFNVTESKVSVERGSSLLSRRVAARLELEPHLLTGEGMTIQGDLGKHATAVVDGDTIVVSDGADERFEVLAFDELPPIEVPWQDLADRYWARIADLDGTPEGVRLVDAETGDEKVLGGAIAYEVHASDAALAQFLTGQALLIELIEEGEARVSGTMAGLSVMVGTGLAVIPRG